MTATTFPCESNCSFLFPAQYSSYSIELSYISTRPIQQNYRTYCSWYRLAVLTTVSRNTLKWRSPVSNIHCNIFIQQIRTLKYNLFIAVPKLENETVRISFYCGSYLEKFPVLPSWIPQKEI